MKNHIVINDQQIDLTEEQVRKITAAVGIVGTKLSEINVGDVFKLGTYEFVVLQQSEDAATVILKDLLPDTTTFGESNNRYDGSKVDLMCCDFAVELFSIVSSENVVPHIVDLTSDDGLKDYGQVERAVSLLTTDEYRHYVEVLDKHKPNAWWWLATPHSTAAHENDRWAKCVSPSGGINYNYYGDVNGVRPFCILKSNIFVSR